MLEFLADLRQYSFLQHALLSAVLASIACGVVGSYVVARRITYLAGGIAHCVLGGMGAALYLQKAQGWSWLHPIYGALFAAILAAVIIGLVSLHGRQREDTAIGALWAIGMAVGIVFISQTPGYNEDLMSYLFGNLLMVSSDQLQLMVVLDLIVVGLVALFYHQFQAVCFDEEFARLRGIPVNFFYLLLLCLTALTVVLLVTVVGIILVIALLTLPVAIANLFARSLWQIMIMAAGISMLLSSSGLALSYSPDLPAGAVIILLTGATYLALLSLRALLLRGHR
ncbi:MAG: metal ABC transporter permease [Geoalkalibacter sp.]|jgi:zinc transport system permease protein|uniref:metal ABC transporter permease n=1 Tax=Geoalkalibacter sp. TaxID=3041440 RepID=UPI002A974B73|nr:metal ABC transporter permease [Thermodesulfobacteriota bacterium]